MSVDDDRKSPAARAVTGATWVGLMTVLAAEFMDLVDATTVTVALPSIAADLGLSPAQVQWMLAGYTLAMGAGLITGGRLGDMLGRRRVFLAGLAAGTFFAITAAVAPTAGWLLASRLLSGVSAAFTVPLVLGLVRASFTAEQRPKALGLYGATLGLASVVGPVLGGALVSGDLWGLGWRAVFWINVPIGIVALVIGWWVLPESRDPRPARLDLVGALLVAVVATLVLLPLAQGAQLGGPGWTIIGLVAATAVAFGLVTHLRRRIARGADPLFPPALFARRGFSAGVGVALVFFGAIGSFFLVLVLYLQDGTGRSAWATGLVLLPYAVGSVITSGLSVTLAARMGRTLLIVGALVLALGQALLLLFLAGPGEPGYPPLAAALFVAGLGLGLAAPPLIDVVLSAVDDRHAGTAAGVLTTATQIGGALGVAVLGSIYFASLRDAGPAAGVAGAHSAALSTALPWQIGAYLLAAGLMTRLPARATTDPV